MIRSMVATSPYIDDVLRLKKEKNCVILAHNYQRGEIQDVADFVGDSLGLAQMATKVDADIILFCGVHFMAETVKILCPDKKVLMPDLNAGCSLASMITADSLRKWKEKYPNTVVVCYVNTTAEVKAESDYCCTSTNALKVVEAIPKDKEILFVPDMYLGYYIYKKTGRKMQLWPGYCHAHAKIDPEQIALMKHDHPSAEFLLHPECGCLTTSMNKADRILSTEGIIKYAKESQTREFIIGTEVGILHRLQKENPDKIFYPASRVSFCEFMKMNTIENVLWSLEDLQYEITVPEDIAKRAKRAIDRMLALV